MIRRLYYKFVSVVVGLIFRPKVSEYEIQRISELRPRLYVRIDVEGMGCIITGGDTIEEKAASRSLAYFLGAELMSLSLIIDERLKTLPESERGKEPKNSMLTKE